MATQLISKNIRHLRTLRGLTQEQLADELNVSRSRIGSYEEGRSEPPIHMLLKLGEYYGLPVDVLIKNDLTKSTDGGFIDIGNQRVLFPITVDGSGQDLIEVVPVKASAGYLDGYQDPEYIENLEKISLPFLPSGKYRAFPIRGHSMLPLKEGALVVCRFVENIQDIHNGKTYVLLTLNDGMVYKRVYKTEQGLQLVSDNTDYKPYEIPLSQVLELWEFAASISTQEYAQHELKLSGLIHKVSELQSDLKNFTSL
jgi:transcriptional regulator with XRE-family HTH domain